MQYTVDMHTHTLASGHAYSTLQENIRYASSIGMEMVGVTEHGVTIPGAPNLLYFHNLKSLPRVMFDVEVLRGVEANIIDYNGRLDMEDHMLAKLDIVIASYHDICIAPSTKEENTKGLLAVMENEIVDIIGHSGNPAFEIDIVEFVKQAKEKDKIIEINNSSLYKSRKGSAENCLSIALEAKKQGAKIILSSDAHISFEIGNFSKAHELVSQAGIASELIMNTPDKLKTYLFKKGKALDCKRSH